MSNPEIAISVEHLSKEFRIGKSSPYGRFSEVVQNTLLSPFKRNPQKKAAQEKFLALDDINFEVKQGEILGIIGRNGAGKSTLLKILSRITPPSSGRFGIRGRVGSLLEVGTGFHPELTGRENVFLNGTIIGMKRSEIARRFDEIVAFAEVEKFIDTPVKHYSSGMYMRLAFSVAAHLDPEILIVDEVLAVGDAGFQKKCLDLIRSLKNTGKTILFVTHNISTYNNMCQMGLYLHQGIQQGFGRAEDISKQYFNDTATNPSSRWEGSITSRGGEVELLSVKLQQNKTDKTGSALLINKEVEVEISYKVNISDRYFAGFFLHIQDESILFSSCTAPEYSMNNDPFYGQNLSPGVFISKVIIPARLISTGNYSVTVIINTLPWRNILQVSHILMTEWIEDFSLRQEYHGSINSIIRPALNWNTIRLE